MVCGQECENVGTMHERFAGYIAWVMATVATTGSLYASEVAHLPPCTLCWYQRILMFPLVVIITVGIFKKDKLLPLYVLPLSILGIGVASYQFLLQRGIFPDFVPCTLSVPCTTKYFEWFGFVTIPFLSLVAFLIITGCMISLLRRQK